MTARRLRFGVYRSRLECQSWFPFEHRDGAVMKFGTWSARSIWERSLQHGNFHEACGAPPRRMD